MLTYIDLMIILLAVARKDIIMANDSIVTIKRIVPQKGGRAQVTITGGKTIVVDKKLVKERRLRIGMDVIVRDNKRII